MPVILGFIITTASVLGGFAAMGGHVGVIWQPWEYVIILGAGLGTFVVANTIKTIKDSGKAILEAIKGSTPTDRQYLDTLGLLFSLMRELRTKTRNEVEAHIDKPQESPLFDKFPTVKQDEELVSFICDYFRLIIMGNARTHEIEALMDEEIQTIKATKLKPYQAITHVSDALPALGIVAAVLGVVKTMASIDKPPDVLGHYIGAALVGTFAGIFFSYGILGPLATKIKIVRDKQCRLYIIVKQSLLAFMNGAMPQVAIEYGRKTISSYERPSIEDVEAETLGGDTKQAA